MEQDLIKMAFRIALLAWCAACITIVHGEYARQRGSTQRQCLMTHHQPNECRDW